MSKISIIVPIYNSEQYLKRCIDSILKQTFTCFELLLIDDGSTDNSRQICDEYACIDDRVRVVSQENKGAGAARNCGIGISTGDFIGFVDSDDWIESDMYENMMKVAEANNCDVVMCDCVKDSGNKQSIYTHNIRPGYYSEGQLRSEYYSHLLIMENIELPATISNCLMLYRIRDNGVHYPTETIRYLEGIRHSEDLLFGAEIMLNSKSFYYMKGCCYYHYCMHDNSISHTFKSDKWDNYVSLYRATKERIHIAGFDFSEQIDKMLLYFLFNAAGDIQHCASLSDKLDKMKNMLNSDETKQMFRRVSILGLPVTSKLRISTLFYKYKCIYILIIIRDIYKKIRSMPMS